MTAPSTSFRRAAPLPPTERHAAIIRDVIRGADVILVMDGGRMIEQGNHDELLERNGAYAELYRVQFAGQST